MDLFRLAGVKYAHTYVTYSTCAVYTYFISNSNVRLKVKCGKSYMFDNLPVIILEIIFILMWQIIDWDASSSITLVILKYDQR